ncbi:hypothetical protein ACRRTK_016165 [Alexandromys fortis]
MTSFICQILAERHSGCVPSARLSRTPGHQRKNEGKNGKLLTFTKVRKEGDIGGDIPKGCTPLASKSASPLPIASVHLFPTTAFGPEGTSLQVAHHRLMRASLVHVSPDVPMGSSQKGTGTPDAWRCSHVRL